MNEQVVQDSVLLWGAPDPFKLTHRFTAAFPFEQALQPAHGKK